MFKISKVGHQCTNCSIKSVCPVARHIKNEGGFTKDWRTNPARLALILHELRSMSEADNEDSIRALEEFRRILEIEMLMVILEGIIIPEMSEITVVHVMEL